MKRTSYVLSVSAAVLLFSLACQPAQPPAAPTAQEQKAPPPLSDGKMHLVFSGATANFPRIAHWLLQGLYTESPKGTFRADIMYLGAGAATAVRHLGEGLAHFTITTPAAAAEMAYKGIGLYSKAYPNIRGLFKMPQRDPITLAVRADLGVSSFDEVIQKKVPLRIVSGYQDGDRAIGFLFAEFLKAYGTSLQELESWGGKLVPSDTSGPGIAMIANGEADSIFHEAAVVASPRWKDLNEKTPMRVLSIREDVIAKLEPFGFHRFDAVLPRGKYPGVVEDVTTIDYSDWIVLADASVPEDIAYRMARIAVERKDYFESQYPNLHPMGSKELGQRVADPREMWKDLGAPLHAGAERYFQEKGLMP